MNDNKGFWVGAIIIAVIIILFLLWWLDARESAPSQMATSTPTGGETQGTRTQPIVGRVVSERSSADVVSIAAGISGTSSFNSYLESSGVKAKLTGKGPYTIFVPSNSAIASLPAGTISGLSAAARKRWVEYHIVADRAIDPDAVKAGVIGTLSGDALNFTVLDDGSVRVNNSAITRAYIGSNGVVYVISSTLMLPEQTVIE